MMNFKILLRHEWIKIILMGSVLLFSFTIPPECRADVPEAQKPEVQHLLDYLKNSGCQMERNGSKHDAQEAVEHIQKKYDYYKDDIKTTEDFIERSASRSSLSGRAYHVLCPGEDARPTADWLKDELERYRKEKTGS